jgi:hypothetical protein
MLNVPCWMFLAGRSLLDVPCWMFLAGRSLFDAKPINPALKGLGNDLPEAAYPSLFNNHSSKISRYSGY